MKPRPILIAALATLAATLAPAAPGSPAPWAATMPAQLHAMADHLSATLLPWTVPDRIFPVEDFGAVGDGQTLNTVAIQTAVEACSAAGGGVVRFAKGDYVTGTIDLRSGVLIEVAADSRILASLDLGDYPERIPQRPTVMDTHMKMRQSLFYGEGIERVGFRGPGTIDFRGSQENFPGRQTIAETPGRPFGIRLIDSRRILVEDITLRDAACWMQNYLNCEDLIFQRMQVDNHANHNNDGLDLDGCRRVIVRDCVINSEDDAMCLKGASLRPTEDILIENCTFVTTCNAFKIGTDTQGDFRRIYVRNVRLGGIPDDLRSWKGRQASTGITLATVDGGNVEDVLISGAVITDARAPIFLRVGRRGRLLPGMAPAGIGALRRIVIEDVTGAPNLRQGSFISGIAGGLIEDIVIRRVRLGMIGGGTSAMAAAIVPADETGYPDAHQFAVDGLPAHGFYLRHAQRVFFEDIHVEPTAADARPLFASGGHATDIFLDGKPLQLLAPPSL